MQEIISLRVCEWLTRGIEHHAAALQQAESDGYADVHLDVLLGVHEGALRWEHAVGTFRSLVSVLQGQSSNWVQLSIGLSPFENMLQAHSLDELLVHQRGPANLYLTRRDWWAITAEELHRFPLPTSDLDREEGTFACYEVSRPRDAAHDPDEFYPSINVYWFPIVAE